MLKQQNLMCCQQCYKANYINQAVSLNNYTTLMESPKSAYFNGEQFDGQIVLGRI